MASETRSAKAPNSSLSSRSAFTAFDIFPMKCIERILWIIF